MPPDSNINDQCLYFQNTPGQPYWLNTAVSMTNTGDSGLAVVGNNTTNVTISCKGSSDTQACPTQVDGEVATPIFELFMSKAAMNFGLDTSDVIYSNGLSPIPLSGVLTAGGSVTTTVTWQSQDTDPTKPYYVDPTNAQANHKCLIARCYTNPTGNVDTTDAGLSSHIPDDQHYAQHNLDIQSIVGMSHVRLPIRAGNPTREPQLVAIQAVPDLNPNPAVLAAILPGLKTVPGFKQISSTPLRKVELNLQPLALHSGGGLIKRIEEIIEEEVRAVLRLLEEAFGKATPKGGGAHGRVRVGGSFFSDFEFVVDPSDAQKGNAYIYHLTQTTASNQPYGGITIALVAG